MIMMNVIIGYLLISSFLSYAHVYPADVARGLGARRADGMEAQAVSAPANWWLAVFN